MPVVLINLVLTMRWKMAKFRTRLLPSDIAVPVWPGRVTSCAGEPFVVIGALSVLALWQMENAPGTAIGGVFLLMVAAAAGVVGLAEIWRAQMLLSRRVRRADK